MKGIKMTEAYVYDAIRTPRGRGKANGALHGVKPISLAAGLFQEVQRRNPGLDPAGIDDIVFGVVSPVGDQGGVLPRAAALLAGLPEIVPGVQLNRFCGSGLEAVNIAAQKIASGWEHLVFAGGVESMSRLPLGSDGGALFNDPETAFETSYIPQGVSADLIATLEGFTRDDVDRYAARSQQRAATAWAEHRFDKSIVPVLDRNGLTLLERDEHMRPDTTVQSLAGLKPAFEKLGQRGGFDDVARQQFPEVEHISHIHHAGNSSGIVDGSAVVVVGSEEAGRRHGLVPRARIRATAVVGSDPTIMLTGPTPATRKLLALAGLSVDDIDLFEINEAFASVVLKFQRDLNIPDEKLNVNGGAIAMGHPLGATGAMLVGTVIDELERRNAKLGVITLCIGGGMGIATLVERV